MTMSGSISLAANDHSPPGASPTSVGSGTAVVHVDRPPEIRLLRHLGKLPCPDSYPSGDGKRRAGAANVRKRDLPTERATHTADQLADGDDGALRQREDKRRASDGGLCD